MNPPPLPFLPTGPRVLLAEADAFHQCATRRLFKRLGASVTVAADGERAVALAATGQHDLVLMAIQLPRLDGLSATRALRKAGLERLPVIALVHEVSPALQAHCAAAGLNDLLALPLVPCELRTALACWVPAWAPSRGALEMAFAEPRSAELRAAARG